MNVNDNFNQLPEGWDVVTLGVYVDNFDAQRIPVSRKDREKRKGKYPYYGASGIIDQIDDYTHNGEYLILGEDGANLLARTKPIAFIAKGKIWVNNHAHVLKGKGEAPNEYLAYYINHIDLAPYVTGTAQPKLNQANMNKIPIPIAPINEQKLIVAEIEKQFSRLDEAVAALKRIKANLKRYKASVLKAAIEGKLTEEWRKHNPNVEPAKELLKQLHVERRRKWEEDNSGKKYKEPALPNITDMLTLPYGWEWATVEQITAEAQIGIVRSRALQNIEGKGVGYIKMNNVTMDGRVIPDGLVYVHVSDDELKRYRLAENDVLFNTRNSLELVGKTGLAKKDVAGNIYNNNLMRIRVMKRINPSFITQYMCSSRFRTNMEKVKKATTNVAALYGKDLMPLPLAIPPEAEQLEISKEVESSCSISEKIEIVIDITLKRAEHLRQSILKKAFSGKLVPLKVEIK